MKKYDVAVIGGGVTGTLALRRLTSLGFSCVLLEAGNEKLIVLSNWSGKPATVTVTVDGKKRQFTIGAGGIFK